jgi:hypothetical protein
MSAPGSLAADGVERASSAAAYAAALEAEAAGTSHAPCGTVSRKKLLTRARRAGYPSVPDVEVSYHVSYAVKVAAAQVCAPSPRSVVARTTAVP